MLRLLTRRPSLLMRLVQVAVAAVAAVAVFADSSGWGAEQLRGRLGLLVRVAAKSSCDRYLAAVAGVSCLCERTEPTFLQSSLCGSCKQARRRSRQNAASGDLILAIGLAQQGPRHSARALDSPT
jgi:hypothetical protein